MKWTVFDFEFTELLPELGVVWGPNLHIACASIMSTDQCWPQVWYETNENFMSSITLSAFVDVLIEKVNDGHKIVTWGGSSSDWRMLCKECPTRADTIKSLALMSIDIPMCSCMSIGTMMGLNAACLALGFSLKGDTASADVPELWRSGQRDYVIQHVSNDSFATMMVLKHAEMTNTLSWISQRGILKTWDHVRFLTVRDCLAMELPAVPFDIAPTQNAKLLARWLLLP